jgi:hypothetical protein
METQFISLSVPLQHSPTALRDHIESVLGEQGEPLRWAITAVNLQTQAIQVEAVVTVAVP